MREARPTAAVIGGVSWNQIIDLPSLPEGRTQTIFATGVREGIGGTGSGKALNLARLGFDTRLHALIGDDEAGVRAIGELKAAGVDVHAAVDPAGTERHVNLMDPHGRRVSLYVNAGTADPAVTVEELADFVAGADYVWVNIAPYARRLLPTLRDVGTPIWIDVHDWDGRNDYQREFVEAASYLFLSDEALDDAVGLAVRLAETKQLVVVTHGKAGATAVVAGRDPLFVPPQEVEAIDPNGAGDAFCAGVTYGHSQGWSWPRSLAAGAAVAAGCVITPHLADPALTPAWLEHRLARA